MQTRTGIILLLVGFFLGASVAGGICAGIIVHERGNAAAALSAAQKLGDDARSSYQRLSDRLGTIVSGLDDALKQAGKIGDLIGRLRARDAVYEGVARSLREIADGLDSGSASGGKP